MVSPFSEDLAGGNWEEHGAGEDDERVAAEGLLSRVRNLFKFKKKSEPTKLVRWAPLLGPCIVHA